jgi:hypothetical protein
LGGSGRGVGSNGRSGVGLSGIVVHEGVASSRPWEEGRRS